MKIAYLILAHTDPKQLGRLVHAINYQCRIFIHLDKKTNDEGFSKINLPENAEFISDRVKVNWGSFNMVKATLNLIKAALDSDEQFTHLVLLSGQDYPIKPAEDFYEFLIENPNKQFIKFINIEDSPEYYLKVASHYYFRDQWFPFDWLLRKVITKISEKQSLILKKPLKNVNHAFGSQWWGITSQCASYILNFIQDNPYFMKYYKTYDCPDEFFFHTIIANSPFYNETDGFQKYTGRGTYKMANFHVIHHSLTKYYSKSDFNELKDSNKYFVRKISSNNSIKLIEKINNELIFLNSSVIYQTQF